MMLGISDRFRAANSRDCPMVKQGTRERTTPGHRLPPRQPTPGELLFDCVRALERAALETGGA